MTIAIYDNTYYNELKDFKNTTKLLKKIQGNNIISTEIISDQDPFADFHKSMQEEAWYWDSNYDY